MNSLRLLAGLAVTGVCAVAASGCGGSDVPSDAVARVGNTVITKESFDHWYESAAKSQAQQGGPAVAPDPPKFAKCVAALKEQQPEGEGEGEDGADEAADDSAEDATFRRQCRQSYNQLKQQVMQFLIQSQWVLQEAEDHDIEVANREVRTLFEDQKKQAFPKEADYKQFLRTSGATEQDILFRIKLDALQNRLTEKIQKDQENITREDVEEYYEENKERFAQPERRDLQVVLTRNKARADQAKDELDGGARFAQVAEKYSIDQASKANDGKLPDISKGQQEKALDDAVFAADRGEIEGPVKTQFGWYVFKVTKTTPANQQSLDDARETIRNLLRSEREQESLQNFIERFREDFKGETKCRKGFIVAECSNAPEEEQTETQPAPGAPEGQAPPPQGQAPPPEGQAPPPQPEPQQ